MLRFSRPSKLTDVSPPQSELSSLANRDWYTIGTANIESNQPRMCANAISGRLACVHSELAARCLVEYTLRCFSFMDMPQMSALGKARRSRVDSSPAPARSTQVSTPRQADVGASKPRMVGRSLRYTGTMHVSFAATMHTYDSGRAACSVREALASAQLEGRTVHHAHPCPPRMLSAAPRSARGARGCQSRACAKARGTSCRARRQTRQASGGRGCRR